ncbi:MAG TPA: hypothetical protein VKY22_00115 [Bradyrhizobium sp.]|nr:hypothetical protein [Bradyrhizobium sp.]
MRITLAMDVSNRGPRCRDAIDSWTPNAEMRRKQTLVGASPLTLTVL